MFRTSRTPRIAAALAVATSMAVLAGCSSTDSGESDVTVGMGTQPWLGYGPWYIAEENGYFDDEGVDVSITNFDNDADMSAAFASNRIQVANMASHTALLLLEQGLDLTIVLLLDASLAADAILTDGSVTDIEGLAGQSIAYEEGGVSDLLLGYALQEHGLSIDDINPVPMDPSDAGAALVGGTVPVAVTYEPYISEAQSANPDTEVIFTAAENAGLISDVLVVDNTFLDANPEAVQRIVNAWGPAIAFYESDNAEAREIIADNVGSTVDALASAFDGVEFYSLADNKEALDGEYLTEVLPTVEAVATQIELLTGGTDLAAVVDSRFVAQAP